MTCQKPAHHLAAGRSSAARISAGVGLTLKLRFTLTSKPELPGETECQGPQAQPFRLTQSHGLKVFGSEVEGNGRIEAESSISRSWVVSNAVRRVRYLRIAAVLGWQRRHLSGVDSTIPYVVEYLRYLPTLPQVVLGYCCCC